MGDAGAAPNILLITTHDLGTHLGCYGWDPRLPSPHLDRLAAQGLRFDNHFCVAPYCSPSRGGILTGCYPQRNGLLGLVNLGWDLPDGNPTLPAELGRAGYDTALFGFQHVAQDPARLGYDRIGDRQGSGCRKVAPEAAAHLRSLAGPRPRPFFVEVGFSEVHRPFGGLEQIPVPEDEVQALPFLDDTPGGRMDLAMFYENIRRMDEAVGLLLDGLDASGHAHDTLVVFTTDHGIPFPRAKATLYDVGLRTCLLMRWPARLPAGQTVSALTSHIDLLPTFLDLAGAPPPDDIDGRSFQAVLETPGAPHRTTHFATKNTTVGDAKRAVRTDRWKYIRNHDEGPALALPSDIEVTASRRDMGDAHLEPRPAVELYDLAADPWEATNLAGTPRLADIEGDLDARLHAHLRDTADPILAGPVPRPAAEAALVARNRDPASLRARHERESRLHDDYERLRAATA